MGSDDLDRTTACATSPKRRTTDAHSTHITYVLLWQAA